MERKKTIKNLKIEIRNLGNRYKTINQAFSFNNHLISGYFNKDKTTSLFIHNIEKTVISQDKKTIYLYDKNGKVNIIHIFD